MGKVHLLPSHLANQIAAGEVVERPSSIVKELIENSIDADAHRIKVELQQGGLAKIQVSDDGEGMGEDDARLALERHATSKIRSADDLHRIATFGFRGEALPSIASVSKLTLTTRARGAGEGVEILQEGGAPPLVKPSGCAEGTVIEVRDLFFNVPARRKFLKSVASEAAHVSEVIVEAALARPDVTFVLVRDGKASREYLRVGSQKERAAQVLPDERLVHCTFTESGVTVNAYLAPPERARVGAVALHLLVNGRPVKDRPLARAVAQAFGSVLESGRYPVGTVHIDVPLESVDVNVHPQKAEVRFANGRELFDIVTRGLRGQLTRRFSIPVISHAPPGFAAMTPMVLFPAAPPRQEAPSGASTVSSHPEPNETRPGFSGGPLSQRYREESPALSPIAERTDAASMRASEAPLAHEALMPAATAPSPFYGRLEFLGQVRATFLVCSGEDGVYILDQHAAAERVTFDRLRRAYECRTLAMQRLLVPEMVTLSAAEVSVLDGASEAILALGVELRAVSTTTVCVHAVPQILSRVQPERVVRDLLAEMGRNGLRPFGDAVDMVLATMACHGSIRAGDVISRDEAKALLVAMDGIDWGGHCPHGRPVVTRLSFDELERRVGR